MKKVLIFVLLCGVYGLSFAQQRDNKPASTQTASADLAAIQTANSLAKYGYSSRSASALIGAAEILVQVQTQALGAKPTGAAATGTKTEKPEFTADNLLIDGKKYAAGDATLLAWAAKVEASLKTTTRGAVGGPREQWDKAPANNYLIYQLSFRAGQLAEIAVCGDGDTDLDLYVFDANGNIIVYDERYSDDCYVNWVPAWTGNYTIHVVNRGRTYNRFVIATN